MSRLLMVRHDVSRSRMESTVSFLSLDHAVRPEQELRNVLPRGNDDLHLVARAFSFVILAETFSQPKCFQPNTRGLLLIKTRGSTQHHNCEVVLHDLFAIDAHSYALEHD